MTVDADRIDSKLYVGGVPPRLGLKLKGFDTVVMCAKEHQFEPEGVETILAPFDDHLEFGSKAQRTVLIAARSVHKRRQAGRRVLVTCAAGVNRSALVAATALVLGGRTPQQAIDLVRATRRPPCGLKPLMNTTFEQWLRFQLPAIVQRARRVRRR